MRRRAVVAMTGMISVAGLGLGSPASAVTGHIQRVPETLWAQPGTAPLDGAGGWVYVAPEVAPAPGQVSPAGYDFEEYFLFGGGRTAVVGLSKDARSPVAGMRLIDNNGSGIPAPVIIPYPWSPGHIYFLLFYNLGGGSWGGWVYDYSGAAWTFIGQAQAPLDWGPLRPETVTRVGGASGNPPGEPFSIQNSNGAVADCSLFPRVDAYFYPPWGWRGSTITTSTVAEAYGGLGDCPTATTTENGWTHYQLGAPPPG